MVPLLNDVVALHKVQEALHDLAELEGDETPERKRLMRFLRDAIKQGKESSRACDRLLPQQLPRR